MRVCACVCVSACVRVSTYAHLCMTTRSSHRQFVFRPTQRGGRASGRHPHPAHQLTTGARRRPSRIAVDPVSRPPVLFALSPPESETRTRRSPLRARAPRAALHTAFRFPGHRASASVTLIFETRRVCCRGARALFCFLLHWQAALVPRGKSFESRQLAA